MNNDPIVEEVRKIREEHAARFDFDLNKIVADLQKSEGASDHKIVSRQPTFFFKATGS